MSNVYNNETPTPNIEYVRVHLSYYEYAQVYISIVCLIMRINEKYNEFPFFYL